MDKDQSRSCGECLRRKVHCDGLDIVSSRKRPESSVVRIVVHNIIVIQSVDEKKRLAEETRLALEESNRSYAILRGVLGL